MKKIISCLLIIICGILITSCSNNNIIPKGYVDSKIYSDASIEQIGHTIQYSVYKYDTTPNLSKNRFLEKVSENDKILLEIFLNDYILKLEEYDKESDSHEFINNYKVDINNISNEDYVYIDYRENETGYEYFVIYYFETSYNELYFLQLIYK